MSLGLQSKAPGIQDGPDILLSPCQMHTRPHPHAEHILTGDLPPLQDKLAPLLWATAWCQHGETHTLRSSGERAPQHVPRVSPEREQSIWSPFQPRGQGQGLGVSLQFFTPSPVASARRGSRGSSSPRSGLEGTRTAS